MRKLKLSLNLILILNLNLNRAEKNPSINKTIQNLQFRSKNSLNLKVDEPRTSCIQLFAQSNVFPMLYWFIEDQAMSAQINIKNAGEDVIDLTLSEDDSHSASGEETGGEISETEGEPSTSDKLLPRSARNTPLKSLGSHLPEEVQCFPILAVGRVAIIKIRSVLCRPWFLKLTGSVNIKKTIICILYV